MAALVNERDEDTLTCNLNLKPLNLSELIAKQTRKNVQSEKNTSANLSKCLICNETFNLDELKTTYLAHLLKSHRLVIGDVEQIGDFEKYNNYWRDKLKKLKIEDICFKINTNTGKNDKGETESYFLLCDNLPEDNELRKKLNIFKLEKAIQQQEIERNDHNCSKKCFFCDKIIENNRSNVISHLSIEHNFNLGHPDNIVYFDEFYQRLNERFESLQCLYCNKIFYDKHVFKEHMRKKKHKSINPNNREFDRFYIINYLEYSKFWQDIKSEKDNEESNPEQPETIEDWNDPVQTFYCLFCTQSYDGEEEIIQHMNSKHEFDFRRLISDNSELSFYNQVKLINYIRRQVFSNSCHICREKFDSTDDLLKHLAESKHISQFPNRDHWDQPEYYFSTFEDDSLLCLLDDEAYSKDESKIKVIPEDVNIKINDELLNQLNDLKC